MNDLQQRNRDRFDKDDAILPGLGIVVGILIGVVSWEFVEDRVTLGPAGLWVAQGCFYAVCVLIASLIDGLIRPWRNRIRSTVVFAVGIVAVWGAAAIAHVVAGDKAATVGWLVGILVYTVIGWILTRRTTHNRRRAHTTEERKSAVMGKFGN